MYTEACQIIVPADSDIYDVSGLEYKTVSIGENESGTEKNAQEILSSYGLSEALVTEKNMNYKKAAKAMANGEIDAMFVTSGIATEVITDLAQDMNIRLLSIDDTHIESLKHAYGSYYDYTVPAGTYEGVDTDIETVGVKAVLVASDSVSEAKAKKWHKLFTIIKICSARQ